MKLPDEHPLLDELLSGQEVAAFRAASLREGLAALSRTRQRRRVRRGIAVACAVLALGWVVVLGPTLDPSGPLPDVVRSALPVAAPVPVTRAPVEFISDAELLALFPDRSLALVGQEGRQRLVFLDESVAN